MKNEIQNAPTLTYIPALTGIRALSAYLVYCAHFNPLEQYHFSSNNLINFTYFFFQEFSIGVTIFFVLSGFLITFRYAGSVKLEWWWFKRYITNRMSRIYPMYFLITALTFIVYSYDISYDFIGQYRQFDSTQRVITQFLNFSLLRGFSENLKFSGITQGWSLTVEECFYVGAPIFLVGISIRYQRIFIYPLLLIIFGISVTTVFSQLNNWGIFGSFQFLFYYTFFGRCIEFFMGMALALYLKENPQKQFSPSGKYTALSLICILISLLIIVIGNIYLEQHSNFILNISIKNLLLPSLICLLYIGLIFENNAFTRLLKTRLFNLLGKSSYTFYLIHMGVIQLFIHRHLTSNSLLLFVLLNTLAVLLFTTIEEPCHKWIKSFAKSRKTVLIDK